MKQRDVNYLVIALMLLSGLYVATTGLVAGMFGLHQLAFHRYAGYLCTSLIVAHIALNWRRMISYVVGRLKRHQRRGRGVVQERRRPADLGRRQVLTAAASAAAGFLLGRLVGERGPDLPGDAADIGALYHAWSTPGHPLDLPIPDWGERVAPHKSYPDAERLVLPDPGTRQGLSVADALETRRSVRSYSDRRLSLEELSNLLHGAQGITDPRLRFRAAPSAGALYPIETYTVVHDVTGLAPGIYHYAVMGHALECLDQGNFRTTVTQAGLGQAFLGQANVCFILSAVFQRTRWRYRERAYRYVLLEAGHIGQNLYLTATSMGLGACAVGAFLDTALNEMLGLDGKAEGVLYVISVGART